MSVLLKISDNRAIQLRAYAEFLGVGITEAIGVLLKTVGAADKVPGFEIVPVRSKADPRFIFHFDGYAGVLLDVELLETLATIIDQCVSTAGTGGKRLTSEVQNREIMVARHRRHSIVIVGRCLDTGRETKRTLTLDVARDLAAQIRAAASA